MSFKFTLKITFGKPEDLHTHLQLQTTYATDFTISKWPTSNCQVCSIGAFNYILQAAKHNDPKEERLRLHNILKEAFKLVQHTPHIILVDVYNTLVAQVEKNFTVRNKMPYQSTNNSQMTILLITLDN